MGFLLLIILVGAIGASVYGFFLATKRVNIYSQDHYGYKPVTWQRVLLMTIPSLGVASGVVCLFTATPPTVQALIYFLLSSIGIAAFYLHIKQRTDPKTAASSVALLVLGGILLTAAACIALVLLLALLDQRSRKRTGDTA